MTSFSYTAEQLDLRSYLEQKEVEVRAWVAEDPQNRWATWPTSDLDHWAEMDVKSIAQYERYNTIAYIYDTYKEVHGIKPRWIALEEMTDEQLAEMADELSGEAHQAAIEQEAEQQESIKEFEKEVSKLIAMGAGTRANAIKWLRDAEDDIQVTLDDGYFEYINNLPYGYLEKTK